MFNIIVLSLKKLKENLPRSIVLICCIVLLSTIILILGNLCQYMQTNIMQFTVDQINQNGLEFKIRIDPSYEDILYIENDLINDTIQKTEKISENTLYDGTTYNMAKIDQEKTYCSPYFTKGMLRPFTLIIGENLSEEAEGENYIWITKQLAHNYQCGDNIIINIDKNEYCMTVKGVVEGDSCYVDYSKLNLNNFSFVDNSHYNDFSIVKKIEKLKNEIDKELGNSSYFSTTCDILSNYHYLKTINKFCSGICILLIIITIALTILCLSNSVKINSDENQKFLGLLKCQGIKNSGIIYYHFFQWIFFTIIGVTVSSIISAIIMHFTLENILAKFFALIGYADKTIISGFAWWMPFISLAVMLGVCMLVAVIESKRLAKIEVTELLKGNV